MHHPIEEGDDAQRVVVTGAAGFIGTRLSRRLVGDGHSVGRVDLRGGPGVERADIRNELGPKQFWGVKVVFHLAALAGVAPSLRDPDGYHRTNVTGTGNVLRAARAAGVERVVVVSSSSVYGECSAPAAEDRALAPLSPYAETKARSEDLAQGYSSDMEIVVVRPFTVFGPGQRPDMLMARMLAGEPVTLFPFVRDFTFVDHIVDGLVAAATTTMPTPFEVFNLGSGRPVRASELVAALETIRGQAPAVEWGGPRPGEPMQTWADPRKARAQLALSAPLACVLGLSRQAAELPGAFGPSTLPGLVSDPASAAPDVSVVLPSYNEAPCLARLIDELGSVLAGREQFEVIAVDDGSTDASIPMLCELALTRPWLRVLSLGSNRGQTAAMAAGVEAARGEVIVFCDADGQNDPADIPRLLLLQRTAGVDVVAGRRVDRSEPAHRRVVSAAANALARRATGAQIHDSGCSLKVFRADVLRGVNLLRDDHRFLPALVSLQGATTAELEVNDRPRSAGRSHYGIGRLPRVAVDLAGLWISHLTRGRPLRGAAVLSMPLLGMWVMISVIAAMSGSIAGSITAIVTGLSLAGVLFAGAALWEHHLRFAGPGAPVELYPHAPAPGSRSPAASAPAGQKDDTPEPVRVVA